MRIENRNNRRVPLQLPATIDTGQDGPLQSCTLVDVSEKGARLHVDVPGTVPDEFMMWMSPQGYPRRRCRVVWRIDNEIGVTFTRVLCY
jgi:hypothetical protein